MSNNPKVLVEFSPEEIAYLADVLHAEWGRNLQRMLLAHPDKEKIAEHQKNQDMQNKLRNRVLDKAEEQGFGDL